MTKREPYFEISTAELMDIILIKDSIRVEHLTEIWRSSKHIAEEELIDCYRLSTDKFTLRIDGKVSMMFGVIPNSENKKYGVIWALGTINVDKHPFRIAKLAKDFINQLMEHYDYLYNYVDAEYKVGVKFVKFLGATIDEPEEFGITNNLFQFISFKKEEK